MADQTLLRPNMHKWHEKRRRTITVFFLQNTLSGIEFSFIDSTVLQYVNNLMKTSAPNFIFGSLTALVFLCPIIFLTPVSRWIDKTRNVKHVMVYSNLLGIIGSFLYIIPFSPYYALTGRFLQGFNLMLRTVMNAEVSRSYEEKLLQQKIPLMGIGVFLGELLGGGITYLFYNVDFSIGTLSIKNGNVCAIPLVFLTTSQLCLVLFFVHNLSKEYDLKAHESKTVLSTTLGKKIIENKEVVVDDVTIDHNTSKGERFFAVISGKLSLFSFDYMFMLILSFYSGIAIQLPLRMYPLIVQNLAYPKHIVSLLFIVYGTVSFFILLVLITMKVSNKAVYYIGLTTLPFCVVEGICVLYITDRNKVYINAILLTVLILSQCLFNLMDRLFVQVTCEKLLTSSKQAFGGSWRLMFYFCGCVFGSLFSYYIYEDFHILFFIHLFICVVFFVVLLVRKRTLSDPVPLL